MALQGASQVVLHVQAVLHVLWLSALLSQIVFDELLRMLALHFATFSQHQAETEANQRGVVVRLPLPLLATPHSTTCGPGLLLWLQRRANKLPQLLRPVCQGLPHGHNKFGEPLSHININRNAANLSRQRQRWPQGATFGVLATICK